MIEKSISNIVDEVLKKDIPIIKTKKTMQYILFGCFFKVLFSYCLSRCLAVN